MKIDNLISFLRIEHNDFSEYYKLLDSLKICFTKRQKALNTE